MVGTSNLGSWNGHWIHLQWVQKDHYRLRHLHGSHVDAAADTEGSDPGVKSIGPDLLQWRHGPCGGRLVKVVDVRGTSTTWGDGKKTIESEWVSTCCNQQRNLEISRDHGSKSHLTEIDFRNWWVVGPVSSLGLHLVEDGHDSWSVVEWHESAWLQRLDARSHEHTAVARRLGTWVIFIHHMSNQLQICTCFIRGQKLLPTLIILI